MVSPLGDYGGPTHTMPPLPGSPAIDPGGGHTNSLVATDQRGLPRVVNGVVDVGAVEAQLATNPPVHITGVEQLSDGTFQLSFSGTVGGSFLVAASGFVDATTSELLYQEPGTGFLTVVSGIIVPPNTWHSYRLELNYASQTYRFLYNGTEVLSSGFVDPGIADFTDASIAALAGSGDPTSQNANGTAMFDNYKVTALFVGTHVLSIQKTGSGQAKLSWTPNTPGFFLLESPSLSPADWMISPSGSTNPITVPLTAHKFYRLYRP